MRKDNLDLLGEVLYGASPAPRKWIGGPDAAILKDAADRIQELSAELAHARKWLKRNNEAQLEVVSEYVQECDRLQQRNLDLENILREYPTHGYDRNGSHDEMRYVCDCGFEDCNEADFDWYKRMREVLEKTS